MVLLIKTYHNKATITIIQFCNQVTEYPIE